MTNPLVVPIVEAQDAKKWLRFDGDQWDIYGSFKQHYGWVRHGTADTITYLGEQISHNRIPELIPQLRALGHNDFADKILAEVEAPRRARVQAKEKEHQREIERQEARRKETARIARWEEAIRRERLRISDWFAGLGGNQAWVEVENKRGRKWFHVERFYCEGHLDAWYTDVSLKVPWENSSRPIPWVLKFKYDADPEWGQRPPLYFQAETFVGICIAFVNCLEAWHHFDVGMMDDFLCACESLSKKDDRVALAIANWKKPSQCHQ